MSNGKRRALWLVLCLVAGGPAALLTLEGLVPILLLCLVAVVVVSRRWNLVPESLTAFGITFSLVAARFVIPDLGIYSDFATRAYFIGVLAAGIVMVVIGPLLKRPSHWFRL